uniref:Uncharacterized protein n=1 Tax=Arundo donax TaxID=35708 RepID=A0A0A8Z8Z6_ARUDO
MPIALASAISDQKGTSSAAVRQENGGDGDDGAGGYSNKDDVKKVLDVLEPFGSAKEMRSRA